MQTLYERLDELEKNIEDKRTMDSMWRMFNLLQRASDGSVIAYGWPAKKSRTNWSMGTLKLDKRSTGYVNADCQGFFLPLADSVLYSKPSQEEEISFYLHSFRKGVRQHFIGLDDMVLANAQISQDSLTKYGILVRDYDVFLRRGYYEY